jgi:hypothetical protein
MRMAPTGGIKEKLGNALLMSRDWYTLVGRLPGTKLAGRTRAAYRGELPSIICEPILRMNEEQTT